MANFKKNSIQQTKNKIILLILLGFMDLLLTPVLSFLMINLLDGKVEIISSFLSQPFDIYKNAFSNVSMLKFMGVLQPVYLIFGITIIFDTKTNLQDTTETVKVANFELPKPTGKGQMGSSWFATDKEKEMFFKKWKEGSEINKGGVVVGVKDHNVFYYDDKDVNTLVVGATRSGKSRRVYFETIYFLANANENMFFNDPKGELYIYSHKYLEKQGYKVININFRNPEKSLRYNFLYYINKEYEFGDKDKAIEMVWDLVGLIVGEPNGEKLWNNGEASVLASGIMYVSFEAPDDRYKNLSNVYYFLANACTMDEEGNMPIDNIYKKLSFSHPSVSAFAVAKVASPRTRSSFFTSALADLRLFTDNKLADMTSYTDVDLNIIATEKVAIFCTIPDEKTTRHVLATLLIDQLYMNLVEIANQNGGRLKRRVNMLIDEFGNLPRINNFDNKLTVCLGRGIKFTLAIQDFGQLVKIYGKEVANIITSNCHDWVYLLTNDDETAKKLSSMTGSYTVQSKSVSSSVNDKSNNYNVSSSANLTKRNLLLPDEIRKIELPYAIILKQGHTFVFDLPDLSQLNANKLFGLGNEEYNLKVFKEREKEIPIRRKEESSLWIPYELEKNFKNKKDENIQQLEYETNDNGSNDGSNDGSDDDSDDDYI